MEYKIDLEKVTYPYLNQLRKELLENGIKGSFVFSLYEEDKRPTFITHYPLQVSTQGCK